MALAALLAGPASVGYLFNLARPQLLQTEDSGWMASAAMVAIVAGAWAAGALALATMLLRAPAPGAQPGNWRPRWIGWLAAFAFGPLLVCIFFLAIGLIQHEPRPGTAGIALVVATLATLVLWQARLRPLAEAMLVSFFAWMALLIVPTFFPDPINGRAVAIAFWLLNRVGLVT